MSTQQLLENAVTTMFKDQALIDELVAVLKDARAALAYLVIGRPEDAMTVDYETKVRAINAVIAKAEGTAGPT